eukprot:scaffold409386_cov31-Prasinocladus_malaysianus.AAC.1
MVSCCEAITPRQLGGKACKAQKATGGLICYSLGWVCLVVLVGRAKASVVEDRPQPAVLGQLDRALVDPQVGQILHLPALRTHPSAMSRNIRNLTG